tara:strand:- start:847 stop:1518 length:672 start_codon:yes stop_codon:yes gene_type:complete
MKGNRILKLILKDLHKLNEEKKKLSKKQKKIARAAPPPDEITGADFKALNKNEANPSQYDAAPGSKRAKNLARAKKKYLAGDVKGAAAIRQGMEDDHMKETSHINELNELLNDMIEEQLLDEMLNELENDLNEKRKRKKKKKAAGGLSAAVKKSLNKKADKRCLTRGSVYTEFRKGLAAFLSSGSRKGMSSHQWAHARVNSANPSKSWASVKKRKTCPKKKKK